MFGLVEVNERIWRTQEVSYHRPFSKRIGVSYHSVSKKLSRAMADFGADESFAKAAGKIREHYGFEINVSAVRLATLECAQAIEKQHELEYAKDYRALPPGSETIVAEADGSMLCIVHPGLRKAKKPRQWEEIRLAVAQKQGSAETFYAASFDSVSELGTRWGHVAKQAGRCLNSPVHCVGDGANWIVKQSEEAFGDSGSFLCDFFHVSEYLANASHSCRPEKPASWRRTQQKRLKTANNKKVIKELEQKLEPQDIPDEEAPVRRAFRYLNNRSSQLNYKEALDKNLPIGSGIVESGHKHVIQGRLKLAGSAWLKENASAMSQLRVLRSNGRWDGFWKNYATLL